MSIATQERLDTTSRIHRKNPVREAFAGRSTNGKDVGYYATKGCAVRAFDNALLDFELAFAEEDCTGFDGDEGWKTLAVCNTYNVRVGYAHLSWYRMPSGRYEFTGYLS